MQHTLSPGHPRSFHKALLNNLFADLLHFQPARPLSLGVTSCVYDIPWTHSKVELVNSRSEIPLGIEVFWHLLLGYRKSPRLLTCRVVSNLYKLLHSSVSSAFLLNGASTMLRQRAQSSALEMNSQRVYKW